ncbi:hypothetical protein, partial [Serratia proteamaculans]|uniref:hypothetical protein n=1 Tax=Serratia proteamaculans TaxID=28151 RepID=UPI0019819C97
QGGFFWLNQAVNRLAKAFYPMEDTCQAGGDITNVKHCAYPYGNHERHSNHNWQIHFTHWWKPR